MGRTVCCLLATLLLLCTPDSASGTERQIAIAPDTAWFSETATHDTLAISVLYSDDNVPAVGVRGFHIELDFAPLCLEAVSVVQGTLLASESNHFESAYNNSTGHLVFDWVILGATDGASGNGSLAEIRFVSAAPLTDCCELIHLDPWLSLLRDPDNAPLAADFSDGLGSHDITPPQIPTLASTTHQENVYSANVDIQINWPTTADAGTCPAGMAGYYLLIDNDPAGIPDPDGIYSCFVLWDPGTPVYATWFTDFTDATWYVHIISVDQVGNQSGVETYGPILLEPTAPAPVSGLMARVTENSDLSIHLSWQNPSAHFVGLKLFRKGFGNYPEYDDPPLPGVEPSWPASPAAAIADSWTEIYDGADETLNDLPLLRDDYYYIAFAYNNVPVYSVADPGADAHSLCYWPGDFTSGGPETVDIHDVLYLSLAYNTDPGDEAYNPFCDIGPTIDYGRTSRSITDNQIDFDDLVILARNYEKTFYSSAKKRCAATLTANLTVASDGDFIEAAIDLTANPGCLLGASIEIAYGTGLELVSVEAGELWDSGPSFFIDAMTERRTVLLDAIALGSLITADGRHGTIKFQCREPSPTNPATPDRTIALAAFRAVGPNGESIVLEDAVMAVDPQIASPGLTQSGVGWIDRLTPNPTHRETTITYTLTRTTDIRITVFDASGRLISTPLQTTAPAGEYQYSWNGHDDTGLPVSPGIYFMRLFAGGTHHTRKLTLIN